MSNILNVGFNRIILPSTTAFTVNSTEATIIKGTDGQLQFDFTDKINAKTIKGDFASLKKLGSSASDLFSDKSIISNDIISKLSSISEMKISVPDVYIPRMDMPVLRNVA